MNLLLLSIESVFFLAASVVLFRRERMYGIFFFFVYIYAIFCQIGYLYFPEISMSIFAYFGEDVWRSATLFIILSGLALFLFLRFASARVEHYLHSRWIARLHIEPSIQGRQIYRLILIILGSTLVLQSLILVFDFSNINWDLAQQDDLFRTHPAVGVFILLVKLSVGTNLALYCLLREPPDGSRQLPLTAVFLVNLLLFLLFTFKLGNRTDDVALIAGICVFECSRIRLRPRHFLAAASLALVALLYLNFLESHRYEGGPEDLGSVEKFFLKDYYPPAHILFAAMANNLVIPLQVLLSNAGNSLMFAGQPYLQAPVTDTFFPGGATRSASYGFYCFTEGYLFAGFWGFLYNGVVLGTLLTLWRSLATTGSPRFNNFVLAVLGSMLINLVRGESSYYLKCLYTNLLPAAVIYLGLAQQRIGLQPRLAIDPPDLNPDALLPS